MPTYMSRAEVAEHMRQHDIETEAAGGAPDNMDWHYDDPEWWTDAELRDAHRTDHKYERHASHTHEEMP